jgi:hypothetical protein
VNKRVCDWYAIDQVRLETAIVDAIKNTLSEPTAERHIEASLRNLMDSRSREPVSDLKPLRE